MSPDLDPRADIRPLAVYLALGAISLTPILAFVHPPFPDHANHLARLYVLTSPPGSPLAGIYEPAWGLIPNVASDVLAVLLHPWLTPERVLQLVAVLGMGGVLLAVALLQRRLFGAVNPLLWLAALPIFNLATSMGYMNYFLGVAVALLGIELWLMAEERPVWIRVLLCNAIGVVLFFCHLSALALFGMIVSSYDLFRLRRIEGFEAAGLLRLAGTLTAALSLPLCLVVLAERPEHVPIISYAGKARVLMAPTYVTHGPAFLLAFFAFALLLYELSRSRLLSVAPAMRPVLALLGLASLLLPHRVYMAMDVDSRLVVGLVFLFIASTRIVNPTRSRVLVLALVLFAVVSARSLLIIDQWRAWSHEVAAFRADLEKIEPGAALLVGGWRTSSPELQCAEARPDPATAFWHLPSFAVVDRSAFVPLIFTARGMQPIRATAKYRPLDIGVSGPVPPDLLERAARPELAARLQRDLAEAHTPGYFVDWPRRFDYLVFLHHGCRQPIVPEHLTELRDGSFYTLYRIRPGSGRLDAPTEAKGS